MTDLPLVSPSVLADVLDELPPRLRRRVDASIAQAARWSVTSDTDHAIATVDAETALTWRLTDGILTAADGLTCSCLLAPRCLHRAVAVAAAGIADPSTVADHPAPASSASSSGAPGAAGAPVGNAREFTEAQRQAAAALSAAGSSVLSAGASGSGAVIRSEVLRAVHQAKLAGLHRAAASGVRIATAIAAIRANNAPFDRAELSDDLLELLLLCHDLRTGTGTDPAALLGTARREYHPVGSLRLYGLCTEAVITASGYGGVVTHLVDGKGALWTIASVLPGGAERVSAAANGPVAVGESGLSHRALGRAGLMVSGATSSPEGRLGAGRTVQAVAATGVAWPDQPAALLWQQPLADQVARAFAARSRPWANRPAGADLLFLEVDVLGSAGPALRAATDTVEIDLVAGTERGRENLRVLAAATGVRLRVIARLLPHLPGTATAIAVHSDALTLPSALNGTIDLTLDQLQRSHVPAGSPHHLPAHQPPEHRVPLPVRPLSNLVHRIALAGRGAAVTSRNRDVQALTAHGLTTTAAVYSALTASTDIRRDAFGRATDHNVEDFSRAWLTAALYLREFTAASACDLWLAPR